MIKQQHRGNSGEPFYKGALQQELKEKVKEGVKPSDLKRSKSAEQIRLTPPTNLVRSKSAQELEPTTTPEQWETKISSLELKLEVKNRELTEKDETITIYSEQLKEKQKEVEELRTKLETANQEQKTLQSEKSTLLDDNLTLKHQGLKDWFKQYQQTQQLEQELKENIDEASSELIDQDKVISGLRGQVVKLKNEKESLSRDLELTQGAVAWRKHSFSEAKKPYLPSNPPYPFLELTLYSLLVISLVYWLIRIR